MRNDEIFIKLKVKVIMLDDATKCATQKFHFLFKFPICASCKSFV